MKIRRSRLALVVLGIGLAALAWVALANTNGSSVVLNQIQATVAGVRSGKTVDARTESAERLANLTQQLPYTDVTVALVSSITPLLDSPDDSVRYWVAIALGNLGPAAKSAAPKLEEMLPEADCINGVITSARGIRYALLRMGIKPPPPPKCDVISG
jgi:hypothetical protein